MESDASFIMMRLLKFPPVENVSMLVRMGIMYRDYAFGNVNIKRISNETEKA